MYLSRSCKTECTNAWYNARNATVCIVYVWMGGHQLLPEKQSLQSPCLGMYINFWPWDTLKPQQMLVQSTMAVVSSVPNPVGSSHWTRASSAPLRSHPCGEGPDSTGRMSSKSQVLQEAICQLWQLSYYPETTWKTGILSHLLVAVLYFQNTLVTSAILFRHPRSVLCFKKNHITWILKHYLNSTTCYPPQFGKNAESNHWAVMIGQQWGWKCFSALCQANHICCEAGRLERENLGCRCMH